ncbi:hypothetical protein BDP81DRAFT_411731 [Colletotrichum phormii]|uniref:Methyltransferase type 12 domain-containing protein n=1 Tax=Colletotrichum phormii TaxID=359342 RepID=A0AAJ0E7R6_9PEZI|nr:uncharacterized protein BDP81DRAFT_411731 [Colletotrichum phormii]KAK1621871.1 hypothetical protein BDP81DRAFT_411731 [Colletotrichum phormii]
MGCYKAHWELDVLHNIPDRLLDPWRILIGEKEAAFERKLLQASYHLVHDAVAELEREEHGNNWAWHHWIFYRWMKAVVDLGKSGAIHPRSPSWPKSGRGIKNLLYDELSDSNACGRLLVRVGRQLTNIVRGSVTPLELMMEDNLLNQYYMNIPRLKDRTYVHLRKIVELYAVKNPGAKVLEIGGGTGGATEIVLQSFGARGNGSASLLDHYTFTDISSGFFEAARKKLAPWTSMMTLQTLDIERDPSEQRFAVGTYDLVVAFMVLHATKNLRNTMANVRKLLKPGGTLLMIETTQDRLDIQLIFGTVPGWWLSEEPERNMSPNVSLQVWDRALKETGFSGIDSHIAVGAFTEGELEEHEQYVAPDGMQGKNPTSSMIQAHANRGDEKGDPCVYLPTNKSTKADISQSLEAIQDRLERAEAFIEIQTQALRRNMAPYRPYSEPHPDLQGIDHPDFYFPATTQVTAGDPGAKHRGTTFPRYESPENAEGDLFSNLPTPRTGSRSDAYQFQMYDLMSGQPRETVPAVRGNVKSAATSAASQPDHANASPNLAPSPAQALLSPSPPGTEAVEERGRVLCELKSFSTEVFTTQAQIAAVAAATANLMLWVHIVSVTPLVSSGGFTNANYGGQMVRETLATLETRVRELQELAETGHSEAWKRLRSGLEGMEPADVELRAHEDELQSQLAAISNFFKNEYNVSSPLHEQDGGMYTRSGCPGQA